MLRTSKTLVLLALLGGAPALVRAQALTFTGSVRARVENWQWFESGVADDSYSFLGVLARGGLSGQGRVFWQVELAAPLLLGLPERSTASPPQGQLGLGPAYWSANDSATNAVGLFLKQAYVRIGARPGSAGHAVRIGRFEFIEGTETSPQQPVLAALKRDRIAHRLIGNFGWSHAQRSFDGLHYTLDTSAQLTLVALRPTQGVFNVNGWPSLDVALAYASFGNRARAEDRADWRGFAVYYRDYREDPVPLKADNRSLAARQADAKPIELVTLGGHYLWTFNLGSATADALAWGALQAGSWGVQDHFATAFSAEAGVQPQLALQPWLRAGYTRSSGDGSPGDERHGTFFQMLPTPRWYARFPFYNLMNLGDVFVSLGLTPTAALSARLEAHWLTLTEPADLWYSGGGPFDDRSFGFAARTSNGETRLATLLDLSAQWRWLPKLAVNGYIGWAKGGAVIDRIHPTGSDAALGYLEVEWRR